jgi:hypothetical protein
MWSAHPMLTIYKVISQAGSNLTAHTLFYGRFIHNQKFTARHKNVPFFEKNALLVKKTGFFTPANASTLRNGLFSQNLPLPKCK